MVPPVWHRAYVSFWTGACFHIAMFVLIISLVGCQSQPTLEEAISEPSGEVQTFEVDAAQLPRVIYLVRQGHLEAAADLLERMKPSITPSQMSSYLFCRARLALEQQEVDQVKLLLNQLRDEYGNSFSSAEKKAYYALEIGMLEQVHQPAALILARLRQSPYLKNRLAYEQNVRAIWSILTSATEQELLPIKHLSSSEPHLAGWLALRKAYMKKVARPSRPALYAAWKKEHPTHMAHKLPGKDALPPGWLDRSLPDRLCMPKSLGLLVPLSGPKAAWGEAIKAGFEFAASSEGRTIYQNLLDQQRSKQGNTVLKIPKSGQIKIHVYDVAEPNRLKEGLAAAHREDVEFLVGPLFKEQVQYIQRHPPAQPLLSLNHAQSPIKKGDKDQIYFYGLSAADEAADAAHFLWRKGFRRPLVLVSPDPHDRDLARTFGKTWEKIAGEKPSIQTFSNSQAIKKLIQAAPKKGSNGELLAIDRLFPYLEKGTEQSVALDQRQELDPSVFQPIDAVYVLTSTSDLVLLKSLLEKQSGDRKPPLRIIAREPALRLRADRRWTLELEQIAFNTLPLLQFPLSGKAWKTIRKHYLAKDEFSMRLFAMGMDAYVLALHLHRLIEQPGKKILGTTGTLMLDAHQTIQRNGLAWIQFYNGKERVVL